MKNLNLKLKDTEVLQAAILGLLFYVIDYNLFTCYFFFKLMPLLNFLFFIFPPFLPKSLPFLLFIFGTGVVVLFFIKFCYYAVYTLLLARWGVFSTKKIKGFKDPLLLQYSLFFYLFAFSVIIFFF